MTQTRITSDYSPCTNLIITIADNGDIVLRIHGPGEMRIATDGGQFHGNDLVSITDAFKQIVNAAQNIHR